MSSCIFCLWMCRQPISTRVATLFPYTTLVRSERHSLARVVAPRDVAQHALGRIEIGLAVGEHRLDELIMAERFAELLAIGGITRRRVEDAPRLADGDAGDIDPAAIKRFHSSREAAAFDAPSDRRNRKSVV